MNHIPELVHELIDKSRNATDVELQKLVRHVAHSPFSSRPLKVNRWLRTEFRNRGIQISSSKRPSVEIHLLKRIHFDEQWLPSTTAEQFVAVYILLFNIQTVRFGRTAGLVKHLLAPSPLHIYAMCRSQKTSSLLHIAPTMIES